MLIVEGTDLLGKTTLCKKLVGTHTLVSDGYIYRHFSRLPKSFDYYWGYVRSAQRRIVQDRFHMSEPCYAYARGETGTMLDPEGYRLIDGYLRGLGAVTVVLVGKPELVRRRFAEAKREEMYDVEAILKANEAFDGLCNDGALFEHDYRVDVDFAIYLDEDTPWVTDEQIQEIVSFYEQRQARLFVKLRHRKEECIYDEC